MSDLTIPSMHDARDAEDQRLLDAGEHNRLIEAYYGVIVARCQARIRNDGEAFDAAAQVVIRLLGELKAGKRYPVPFRVVVQKVTGWKIAEHFAAQRPATELGEDATPDDGGYDEAEERQDLSALLDDLPPRERDVAALRILGGLDPTEIAAQLGISRNNVDQAWHRAKRKLRERLVTR